MKIKVEKYNDYKEIWEETDIQDICLIDYMLFIDGKNVDIKDLVLNYYNEAITDVLSLLEKKSEQLDLVAKENKGFVKTLFEERSLIVAQLMDDIKNLERQ